MLLGAEALAVVRMTRVDVYVELAGQRGQVEQPHRLRGVAGTCVSWTVNTTANGKYDGKHSACV